MHRSIIVLFFLLSGCTTLHGTSSTVNPFVFPMTELAVADGVSVINSQKTLEDHFISWITGENCSSVRSARGYPYCVDDTPPIMVSRDVYCYKSIAAVTCYDRPFDNDISQFMGTRRDYIPVIP